MTRPSVSLGGIYRPLLILLCSLRQKWTGPRTFDYLNAYNHEELKTDVYFQINECSKRVVGSGEGRSTGPCVPEASLS